MHIFFSGIGGGGVGPLALIAKQAGYDVSGSDMQESSHTQELKKAGISFYIGQTAEKIAELHNHKPIDWFVYSSALPREDPDHPELAFVEQRGIKHSKRDELLNYIITDKHMQLVAIAGTHGKSTTTAMVVWLLKCLQGSVHFRPFSYSIGAEIPFGQMGAYTAGSQYFVYECDEFDRNFLAFHPGLSLITGLSWDHHEVFPTRHDYDEAFRTFVSQSEHTIAWQIEATQLHMPNIQILDEHDPAIDQLTLLGEYNRQDAWQAITAVHTLTGAPIDVLMNYANKFPGLKQRMELLYGDGQGTLWTNYAHTPEKIRGGMLTASDFAKAHHARIVVIYEPLTNRRQHFIMDDYQDCFAGATKLYWVPTYLAREDPNLPVLTPTQLIAHLAHPETAEPAKMDATLLEHIKQHLAEGDMVVAMGASGGGSLDEWLRQHFSKA